MCKIKHRKKRQRYIADNFILMGVQVNWRDGLRPELENRQRTNGNISTRRNSHRSFREMRNKTTELQINVVCL